jgi:hypothetical protein
MIVFSLAMIPSVFAIDSLMLQPTYAACLVRRQQILNSLRRQDLQRCVEEIPHVLYKRPHSPQFFQGASTMTAEGWREDARLYDVREDLVVDGVALWWSVHCEGIVTELNIQQSHRRRSHLANWLGSGTAGHMAESSCSTSQWSSTCTFRIRLAQKLA